ncbi:hypothetical protein KHA80_12300 [Anaerobacillus sp. HL2]|nr:hypothetical protein KHA80_12300 [Anaerobacillus sp. HL2]
MLEIYAGNTLIQTIRKVMSANVRETLESLHYLLLFWQVCPRFKTKQLAKLNGQYFEIVQIAKSLQGSLPECCSVTCEHVSYILNEILM